MHFINDDGYSIRIQYLNDFLNHYYSYGIVNCDLLHYRLYKTNVYHCYNNECDFIIKIYFNEYRSLHELCGQVELLNILYFKGAKVAKPIADLNGHFVQTSIWKHQIIYVVLYTYAAGRVQYHMTSQQVITVGRELAWIHNITVNLQLLHLRNKVDVENMLVIPMQLISSVGSKTSSEYSFLLKLSEDTICDIDKLDCKSFSYGIVHRDFLPHNFHFDAHQNITIFDFDLAGEGFLIYDIIGIYAHYILMIHYDLITKDDATAAIKLFIDNYTQVRAVSKEEMRAIRYFGIGFWIYYISLELQSLGGGPAAEYLQNQILIIKCWLKYFDDIYVD
jgi:Ser/Thr protein kinase RdoA (MazF antagonist)